MNRRHSLIALAALGASASRIGFAQAPGKTVLVAGLSLTTRERFRTRAHAFEAALAAGARGKDRRYNFEWRFADNELGGLKAPAAQLAALPADVYFADSSEAAIALRGAAPTKPIVVAVADDPVASRLAESLAKPGGNVTGLTAGDPEETLRAMALFATVLRKGAAVGVLADSNNSTYRRARSRTHHAALAAGMRAIPVDAHNAREIEEAFAGFARDRMDAVFVMNDPVYRNDLRHIVALGRKLGKPVLYPQREYVEAGGLMSYGPDLDGNYVRAARFVERLLDGVKPGDLAIESPPAPELWINDAAVRSLRLALPKELAGQAKHVRA